MELEVRNVNEALYRGAMIFKEALDYTSELNNRWNRISPRGNETLEYSGIWATTYKYPDERVLFSAGRDANPFFHFMEGLWMLAGREDVAWISQFNSRIAQYSDDGVVFNAPYGYRLRHHFDVDQLQSVIRLLRDEPDSRRAVAVIFDPTKDYEPSQDLPCNCMLVFKIRSDRLNMRIYNRSNDMIWGAYGANAVHFTMIQEYVAGMLRVPMGEFSQVTDCMHLYADSPNWAGVLKDLNNGALIYNPYKTRKAVPYDMMQGNQDTWDRDCQLFTIDGVDGKYNTAFFNEVAVPILRTWQEHKHNRRGLDHVHAIAATDWRIAITDWLTRRYTK